MSRETEGPKQTRFRLGCRIEGCWWGHCVGGCWRCWWGRRDRVPNLCGSHRRRQLSGINPGKSHGQGPWVIHERHRLDDSSSANRRKRSCSILLLGDGDYKKAKASAHKARVTDCVLIHLDVSPPSLYILG